eukprot:4990-Heterococcus_DN1.PRE.3
MWRDPSALQRHLDAGHSINALDENGHPLLFRACGLDVTDLSKGSDTLVKQLLLAGAHVDSTSCGGFTPLMFTSSPDVANCLLDNGADIRKEADDSSTALDEACGAGKLAVVKVLLKRGAHGQMLRKSRLHTPLAAAVNNHHEEVAILLLQELVQQPGFNINHSRLAGNQPLLCCTAAAGLCRVAEYALDHSADPNILGPNGTPLIIAAKFRQVSMVNLLCERGADLQMRFGYRNSLDQAVISGAVKVVKTLIRHGADVDVVFDSGSMSAVMQAIALGDSDIVQLLLDAGAALDAEQVCEVLCAMCDKVDDAKAMQIFNLALPHCSSIVDNTELGQKVLIYAVAKNKLQVAQALHAAGVSVHYSDEHGTLMHRAASSGNVAVVQWLQSLGVDARAVSAKTQLLPLHFACEAKHLQLAEYFLSLPGAAGDVHARTAAKWQTPLYCAAASAADSVVELLLQRGANANEVDIIGITPLMAAKSLPVVKLLLAAGADATAATLIGKTVLQCQAQQGACAGTVCLLLEAGADPTVAALTDGNYVTAAHMAGISGHFALEKL